MDIQVVITTICVMGIMIAIGALFATRVNVTQEVKYVLILLILNIAVPAVILNGIFSVEMTGETLSLAAKVFGISIAYHLGALALVAAFAKIARFKSTFAIKMTILGALGNTGFIGIPLAATIFGAPGGFLAAIFDAGLSFIVYTVVIYLLQAEGRFHLRQLKAVINVPVMAIIIGILVAVTGFKPPQMVIQLTNILAGIAAPMAMLYVGMLLPPLLKKKRQVFFPEIWFPLSFRLLAIPLSMMAIFALVSFEGWIANMIVLQTAMPTAMVVAVLFSRFTDEEDTAVVTIFASTLLSLATIPFLAYLML
ncbi:auxin efflux carrier [Jeotgalibacillus sp. S-D1]|uniref:AEC family transporter n=1 Tax=Jeotgalibacillus sp. S-D1 TaxID=2552189 RepID=UPI0010597D78|nr:AEC family transporter [Jeotgalibacillus sp. S-D1]TDL31434.1 auxin efflux carrier [Jeotgalibacillus sp. S-D1]